MIKLIKLNLFVNIIMYSVLFNYSVSSANMTIGSTSDYFTNPVGFNSKATFQSGMQVFATLEVMYGIRFSDGTLMTTASGSGGTSGPATWGAITGTLSTQTDLQSALNLKLDSSVFSTHTALKGQPNGFAGLDSLGKVPMSQLPVFADEQAIWGEITGVIANQADLSEALNGKQSISEKSQPNGYAALNEFGKVPLSQLEFSPISVIAQTVLTADDFLPEWQYQGQTWADFPLPPVFENGFSVPVSLPSHKLGTVTITYSEMIGIFDTNWCNVGLFLDDSPIPFCNGSWSGSPDTTIFNQEHLHCKVTINDTDLHRITAKHRSQYCVYGNNAFDNFGLTRSIVVEK